MQFYHIPMSLEEGPAWVFLLQIQAEAVKGMLVALESRCASCTIVCQGAVSLLENRSKEPELWGSAWIWPRHPPEPFPATRQRKRVLRAAGDGPLPPLGFSFSFFALFRYVKIQWRKAWPARGRGCAEPWVRVGGCPPCMGPPRLPPSLSFQPEMLGRIPAAGPTLQQPRGHGASLAP